jgi:transposase
MRLKLWARRCFIFLRIHHLPPYSPDLNPIEQLFSKLKALLRKAAERTIPRLLRKIRSLLRAVSPDECLNFFRHAGYASKWPESAQTFRSCGR